MTPSPPWTVEQAAEWLSRSPEYVRRLARSGELRGAKSGRDWRFSPDDVRALLVAPKKSSEHSGLAEIVEARLDAMAGRMKVLRRSS